jgi:WD40 repeat protein
LNWEQGVTQFQYYSPRVEKRDFNDPGKASSLYTKTVFIPNSEMAVTGTNKGVILVWDRSLIVEGIGEQNEKRLMKVVNFSPEPITILTTAHDKYLVCGFGDGKIKFYDFQFKIMAWFDDLYFHRIKSISFSKKKPLPSSTKKNQLHYDEEEVKGKEKEEIFACSDFLVADESALICSLQSTLFEAIKASEKKG